MILHGAFRRLRASSGVGTTDSRSRALRHGRCGSRAAAPKHRGLEETNAREARSASRTSPATCEFPKAHSISSSTENAPAAANVGAARASRGAALSGSSTNRFESQASSSVSMRIRSWIRR